MKLFVSPTSPFARKVLMLVYEKRATSRIDVAYVDPWRVPEELVKLNPLSRVPTLVLDDQRVIIDSDVIAEYLDRHLPGSRLLGKTGDDYWHERVMAGLISGIIEASIEIYQHTDRCPQEQRCQEWRNYHVDMIRRSLDMLESEMDRLGQGFDYASICMVSALGHMDFRQSFPDWRENRPRLATWYQLQQGRASVQATKPRLPVS